MAEVKLKGGRPSLDNESSLIVETGMATQTQIAKMFGVDPKRMPELLRGLAPDTRAGSRVYSIAEAASRLVKPGYIIESYLRRMNHADLPPKLSSTFWESLRKRQVFEENAGDLWRTGDVINIFSVACAAARMSLMLSRDTVERQTVVTVEQRDIITTIIDQTIVDLQESLINEFSDYESPTDRPGFADVGLESEKGGTGFLGASDNEEEDHGL